MSENDAPVVLKDAYLGTLRTWLNGRPDLLLAIAKRHTSNPLLQPLPSSSAASASIPPTLKLSVPQDGLKIDKLRIKISTKARNVEVDIPLPATKSGAPGSSINKGKKNSKGELGDKIEEMGEEALRYFDIPQYPKIEYFEPPTGPSVLVIYPLLLLLFLVLAPKDHGVANMGRDLVNRYLGNWMIPAATWIAGLSHLIVEPLVIIPKLIQHQVPLLQSLFYLFTVICIGYGGIDALNRAANRERIRLIHAHSADNKKSL